MYDHYNMWDPWMNIILHTTYMHEYKRKWFGYTITCNLASFSVASLSSLDILSSPAVKC